MLNKIRFVPPVPPACAAPSGVRLFPVLSAILHSVHLQEAALYMNETPGLVVPEVAELRYDSSLMWYQPYFQVKPVLQTKARVNICISRAVFRFHMPRLNAVEGDTDSVADTVCAAVPFCGTLAHRITF
jgi:hypothetical protein